MIAFTTRRAGYSRFRGAKPKGRTASINELSETIALTEPNRFESTGASVDATTTMRMRYETLTATVLTNSTTPSTKNKYSRERSTVQDALSLSTRSTLFSPGCIRRRAACVSLCSSR